MINPHHLCSLTVLRVVKIQLSQMVNFQLTFSLDRQEFFLKRCEILLLPSSMPEQIGRPVTSKHISIHGATVGPVVGVWLPHEISSNIQRPLFHPNVRALSQNLSVISAWPVKGLFI
jgi:hypothetical protein